MKKIIFIFINLFAFCSYGQLALENFEDTWAPVPAASGTSTNWLTLDNGIGTNITWVQAQNSTATPSYEGVAGSHAAFLDLEDVPSGNAIDYLVSPVFSVPANGQLYFQSRLTNPGNQGSSYKVKILPQGADARNIANYVDVTTWTEGQLNPVQTNYYEKTVPIPAQYVNTSVRIAFVMQGDNMDRWLIDWARVTAPCLNPGGFTANVTGLGTVDLAWTNPGAASSWEIEIVPQDASPTGHGIIYNGTLPYPATSTATGLPLVQTLFTPHTTYKFYVRALCNDTGISAWVGPLEFTTAGIGDNCSIPLQFSQLPYSTHNNTGNFSVKTAISPGAGCGPPAILGYGMYASTYRYTAAFTGNVRIEMADDGGYGALFLYDECEDIGHNCMDGRFKWDDGSGDLVIESFPVIEGEDYYINITSWQAVPTEYTLLVQEVTCELPVGIIPDNPGDTSVNISWQNPGGATQWELEVQEAFTGIPTSQGEYSPTTNTGFNVEGLTPGTYYEYYVRAACGNGVFSPWAGPYRFYTRVCEASQQCSYTFVMTDLYGDKWLESMTVTQNGVPIAQLTGPPSNSTELEVQVQVCPDIPLQVTWNMGGAGYHYSQQVGLTIKNSFGQEIYTMPEPEAGGYPGVVMYQGTVNCSTLVCEAPTGLVATNATQNSVDLSWNGPSTGTWEYYIVPSGEPAPAAATTGTAATSNPVTNVSLTAPATNYDFYVRMVCQGGGFSNWSAPQSFGSAACAAQNKCAYTFIMRNEEDLNINTSGWGGAYMTIYQQGVIVARIGNDFMEGRSKSVDVNLCDGIPFEIEWTYVGNPNFNPNVVSLDVYNPMHQRIFNLPPDSFDAIGTIIYTGTVDCDALLCLAPTDLYAENATTTTADIGWAGMPSGNWEYYIVPEGSAAPTAGTTGIPTVNNPATGVELDPSITNYDFYVRMVCPDATEGFSDWSDPHNFSRELCSPEDKCLYTLELWGSDPWFGSTQPVILGVYQAGVLVEDVYHYSIGTGPAFEQIALCPGIPFQIICKNNGNIPGISLTNPFGEIDFIRQFGSGTYNMNEIIYSGIGNCTPTDCLKPQHPEITNILPDQVTLNWQEMGTATSWQVWVLPSGSQPPVAGVGGITVTEKPFVYGDDPGETLTPATDYNLFVMAICGPGQNSSIDGVFTTHPNNSDREYSFSTAVANDLCEGAIHVPVNAGDDCVQSVTGNTENAYGSILTVASACPFPAGYPDVWYSFEATSTVHTIDFTTSGDNYLGVFKGDCGSLVQIYCDSSGPVAILSDLTPGETYYIRISNFNVTTSPFRLCIKTAVAGPSITVSESDYTIPQLVDEFLLGSECGTVSNITAVTGSQFGSNNGIGYFNRNGSDFPLDEGIVLATGSINQALGPWPGIPATLDTKAWRGDADLDAIFPGADAEPSYNASIIEFDFVPSSCRVAFDFVFASDIYGIWECVTDNGAAILLTGPSGTQNLALVPNTTTPVSTSTVRSNTESCGSRNEQYVGDMSYTDPLNSATGYSGYTVAMEASSPVVAGQQYHLKIVIADQPSHFDCHNSAIFIKGKECSQQLSLGPDLIGTGAVCADGEAIINSGLNPSNYNFVWLKGDVVLAGETSSTLSVTASAPFGAGTYQVKAYPEGSDCYSTGTITVEFTEPIIVTDPVDLIICSGTGFGVFDLSLNTTTITGENPHGYTVTYYDSLADADTETDALDPAYTNTVQNQQPIYVRIEDAAGCAILRSFNLITQDRTPEFTVEGDMSLCQDASGQLEAVPSNFNAADVTYTWTRDGNVLPDTTSSITIEEAGIYTVKVNNTGCTASRSVTVIHIPEPQFSLGGPYALCSNETATISVSEANFNISEARYAWTVNGQPVLETGSSIQTSGTGTYSVTVTLGSCPPVMHSVEVVKNDSNVAVQADELCENDKFYLRAIDQNGSFEPSTATYLWSGPNAFTATTQQFEPPVSGSYSVTVTTAEGCIGIATVAIQDTSCFIQKGISPNNDGLNDTFNLATLDVRKLTIYNRYGQEIYGKSNYISEWGGQDSNGNELPTGTYFYMIERNNGEQLTGWIYINREE
jgi:gliding motility-associated-like protein